ncbi:MAG: HU family DNA-binding protein [Marinobacterium sp.]
MRKSDQVDAMTQAMKIEYDRAVSKADVNAFLDAFAQVCRKSLAENGEFIFHGVGKFSVSDRKAREGRNPMTGEPMTFPACKFVKFKSLKPLKQVLNPESSTEE